MVVETTEKLVSYKAYLEQHADTHASVIEWTDFKWQLANSIRTINAFEQFTGITFLEKEKQFLRKTTKNFP